MKESFCGKSFSLGYLTCLFNINKSLSEANVETYISRCKDLGQSMDDGIKDYILSNYPHLLN